MNLPYDILFRNGIQFAEPIPISHIKPVCKNGKMEISYSELKIEPDHPYSNTVSNNKLNSHNKQSSINAKNSDNVPVKPNGSYNYITIKTENCESLFSDCSENQNTQFNSNLQNLNGNGKEFEILSESLISVVKVKSEVDCDADYSSQLNTDLSVRQPKPTTITYDETNVNALYTDNNISLETEEVLKRIKVEPPDDSICSFVENENLPTVYSPSCNKVIETVSILSDEEFSSTDIIQSGGQNCAVETILNAARESNLYSSDYSRENRLDCVDSVVSSTASLNRHLSSQIFCSSAENIVEKTVFVSSPSKLSLKAARIEKTSPKSRIRKTKKLPNYQGRKFLRKTQNASEKKLLKIPSDDILLSNINAEKDISQETNVLTEVPFISTKLCNPKRCAFKQHSNVQESVYLKTPSISSNVHTYSKKLTAIPVIDEQLEERVNSVSTNNEYEEINSLSSDQDCELSQNVLNANSMQDESEITSCAESFISSIITGVESMDEGEFSESCTNISSKHIEKDLVGRKRGRPKKYGTHSTVVSINLNNINISVQSCPIKPTKPKRGRPKKSALNYQIFQTGNNSNQKNILDINIENETNNLRTGVKEQDSSVSQEISKSSSTLRDEKENFVIKQGTERNRREKDGKIVPSSILCDKQNIEELQSYIASTIDKSNLSEFELENFILSSISVIKEAMSNCWASKDSSKKANALECHDLLCHQDSSRNLFESLSELSKLFNHHSVSKKLQELQEDRFDNMSLSQFQRKLIEIIKDNDGKVNHFVNFLESLDAQKFKLLLLQKNSNALNSSQLLPNIHEASEKLNTKTASRQSLKRKASINCSSDVESRRSLRKKVKQENLESSHQKEMCESQNSKSKTSASLIEPFPCLEIGKKKSTKVKTLEDQTKKANNSKTINSIKHIQPTLPELFASHTSELSLKKMQQNKKFKVSLNSCKANSNPDESSDVLNKLKNSSENISNLIENADILKPPEISSSRRKRKNVAHKLKSNCHVEPSVNSKPEDFNSQNVDLEDEAADPIYQKTFRVTEPSSGKKLNLIQTKKVKKPIELSLLNKKFLSAGLYSDSFKNNESSKLKCKEMKEYNPNLHKFGLLPPPIDVGYHLREKLMDYELPYDLWWLHENNKIICIDARSTTYKKIRTNIYVDIRPDNDIDDHQSCNCAPPKNPQEKGCGSDCLNRLMYVECLPQLCPCKDQCSNQNISKHEWSPGLERFLTRNRGWGIRTTEILKSGQFILEYVGEVVSENEFRRRMNECYQDDQNHYCLGLDSGTVIDGYRMAGEGRFVNHSCDPNCEMQKWFVNGQYRVGLFALKDIAPYTELSYDYNFSNYNLKTLQKCRCGKANCRGFIGGRSQRLNVEKKNNKPTKLPKKKGHLRRKREEEPVMDNKKDEDEDQDFILLNRYCLVRHLKALTRQQQSYVREQRCFLVRNHQRVKRAKDRALAKAEKEHKLDDTVQKQEAFYAQYTALNTSRSVKTRKLANAESLSGLTKAAKLAQVLKHIFTEVTTLKGENGSNISSQFFQLPSRKKYADYYSKIKLPIDFAIIEKNIFAGEYMSIDAFEKDFFLLFDNTQDYYGKESDIGFKITLLRKAFADAKNNALLLFDGAIENSLAFTTASAGDDIVRCICNIYKERGLMIQCEKCFVWQHCDCIGVNPKIEHYFCNLCTGVEMSKDILLLPRPNFAVSGCKYYVTKMQGHLQVKQGDYVYYHHDKDTVLDTSIKSQLRAHGLTAKHAGIRDSLRSKDTSHHDIFQVERIWEDANEKKYVFGYHFLRPHETYHEPTKRFFTNEVFKSPFSEVIPLESIIGHCSVLDLQTYCMGRLKGFKDQDTYICEYRVDLTAQVFSKIHKVKYPVNTEKYVFDHYEKKLNPKRNFMTPVVPFSSEKKGDMSLTSNKINSILTPKDGGNKRKSVSKDYTTRLVEKLESREKKRLLLNQRCLNLLNRFPSEDPADLSYLLLNGFGKRRRKVIRK